MGGKQTTLEGVAGGQSNGACELQASGEVVRSLKF